MSQNPLNHIIILQTHLNITDMAQELELAKASSNHQSFFGSYQNHTIKKRKCPLNVKLLTGTVFNRLLIRMVTSVI